MITTAQHHTTLTVDGKRYRVVLEEGPRNWSAYVPALPGLAVVGADREAVKAQLREAIPFHLEGIERRRCAALAQRQAVG